MIGVHQERGEGPRGGKCCTPLFWGRHDGRRYGAGRGTPKTEATDRREKLLAYRNLESLKAYLIVAHERQWIEHHFRNEDGEWRNEIVEQGNIPLRCPPNTSLALDEV